MRNEITWFLIVNSGLILAIIAAILLVVYLVLDYRWHPEVYGRTRKDEVNK